MRAEDIRAYLERDRTLVDQSRAEHWAHMREQHGASTGLRVASDLRAHAQSLHPEWPEPEERATDLAAHERLAELFHRVGKKLPR